MTTADASKFLRTKPGFDTAIRSVSTFWEFVRLFPTTLTLITANKNRWGVTCGIEGIREETFDR